MDPTLGIEEWILHPARRAGAPPEHEAEAAERLRDLEPIVRARYRAGVPLRRITDLRRVRLVVANGRRYDPAPLWRSLGFTP